MAGLALVALVALAIVIARKGPDRTLTGTITELKSHRVCIADGDASPVCMQVDAPERLTNASPGDCVRARYSAEGILISIDPMTDGCGP